MGFVFVAAALATAALLTLPIEAGATNFKCGKKFITFQIEGSGNKQPMIITVPRGKVSGVVVTDHTPSKPSKGPTLGPALDYDPFQEDTLGVQAKVTHVITGHRSHTVTMKTGRRLIECLN